MIQIFINVINGSFIYASQEYYEKNFQDNFLKDIDARINTDEYQNNIKIFIHDCIAKLADIHKVIKYYAGIIVNSKLVGAETKKIFQIFLNDKESWSTQYNDLQSTTDFSANIKKEKEAALQKLSKKMKNQKRKVKSKLTRKQQN